MQFAAVAFGKTWRGCWCLARQLRERFPGSKGLYFQWFGFELPKNHAGRTC